MYRMEAVNHWAPLCKDDKVDHDYYIWISAHHKLSQTIVML